MTAKRMRNRKQLREKNSYHPTLRTVLKHVFDIRSKEIGNKDAAFAASLREQAPFIVRDITRKMAVFSLRDEDDVIDALERLIIQAEDAIYDKMAQQGPQPQQQDQQGAA